MAATSIWRPLMARSRLKSVKGLPETSFLASRRPTVFATHIHIVRAFSSSQASPKEPLRILFCGSDAFSCASLQVLHNAMQSQKSQALPTEAPGRIASLDVVVRPAKRTGRGRATIIESPVKVLATELGLPVHERDTFTGWTPPPSEVPETAINMIVAVSFGLFVPKRLLRAARYGGLNVHPSLLPDLHGSAPIEHAVLLGRPRTGVTIQTLDETTFDGGRRLLQGPYDEANAEVGLPLPPRCTSAELHQLLAPLGANLLVEVIRRGLYLPEHADIDVSGPLSSISPQEPAPAPKLTKADQQVLWQTETAVDIDRRARALGELWTQMELLPTKKERKAESVIGGPAKKKRAILDKVDLVACPDSLCAVLEARGSSSVSPEIAEVVQTAIFVQEDGETHHNMILPFTVDGESIVVPVGVDLADKTGLSCLRIGSIKVEGEKTKPAARAMAAFASKGDEAALDKTAWDVVLRL
ncbi:Methionyl-tRNA formyltransferase [Sporothrix bragantina]|uniref:methionyl-tRNA formyltransferase n=1 Tax=Sporothrix bragantina TaxID=671064 RepID=A0ABP0CKZ2_9PEZI